MHAVNSTLAVRGTDISLEVKEFMYLVNNNIFGHLICGSGITSNIINIIIFTQNGFADAVNISLFALAVSDLCSLITLEWMNILQNPLSRSRLPWSVGEVLSITGGSPHASFARITSWITAFITFERCLCVTVPLRVRRIITARVTVLAMFTIYILMLATHVPEYASFYLGWKFYPSTNKTLIGLIARGTMDGGQSLTFTLAVIAQIVSFIVVIFLTVLLVTEMKRKSKWRQEVTSGDSEISKLRLKRDDRVVKMIVLISVIYIVCFFSSIVAYVAAILEPELNARGVYKNINAVLWSAIFTLEAINSSVNIFVYYNMSSKYKATFHQLICRRGDDNPRTNSTSRTTADSHSE